MRGLLLINLGTPEAPTPEKVRDYLAQFLMDPDVIDIPGPFRWLLVHGAILRKRPAQSAEAYRKIWTERGSPLLFNHLDLAAGVQAELDLSHPGEWKVEAGMRYGQPSIERALGRLREAGVRDIVAFPLYPQYSLAATASSVKETKRAAALLPAAPPVSFVPAFYEEPEFIEAFAEVVRAELAGYDHDHVLFSFHGLPERQVKKTDRSGAHCLADASCCDRIVEANADCYRAQCYATARSLASSLGIPRERYSVCFQSRLGRTPWIKPYTDELYSELPKRGIRRVAVVCPAFVADCLETLEEIRIRGKESFLAEGGEDLRLVTSLNATPGWIRGTARLAVRLAEGARA